MELAEYKQLLVKVHGATQGQLGWFEAKLAEYGGSLERFWEMFPATPEEAFRVSGTPVFSSIVDTLIRLAKATPDPSFWGDITISGFHASDATYHPKPPVEIIRQPEKDKLYAIGADVGEGLKQDDIDEIEAGRGEKITKTYSTASVRDIETWELCALVECQFPLDIYAGLLDNLGRIYNNALLGVEVNNAGHAVIKSLLDSHYPTLYCSVTRSKATEFRNTRDWGWQTTAQSKPQLESRWETFVRETPDMLGSPRLASQGLTYVQLPNGHNGPQRGCFSDLLFADMICIQMLASAPTMGKIKSKTSAKMKQLMEQRKRRFSKRGTLFKTRR